MQLIIDAALGVWIVAVAVLVTYGVPSAASARGLHPPRRTARLAAGASALALFAIAIPFAAAAHLFNWLTALAICGFPLALRSVMAGNGGPANWFHPMIAARREDWTLGAHRIVSRWRLRVASDRSRVYWLLTLLIAARPTFRALANLRLPSPEDYVLLRASHALLAGGWTGVLQPAPSLIAIVARLAAADPMQVVRFLHPVLFTACALLAAFLVGRLTALRWLGWGIGLAAGFALETPFFRVGPAHIPGAVSVQDLLAIASLLAGFTLLYDARRRQSTPWHACASFVVAAASLPATAVSAAAGAVVLLVMPIGHVAEGLGAVLIATALVGERAGGETLSPLTGFVFVVGAGLVLGAVARAASFELAKRARRAPAFARSAIVVPGLLLLAMPQAMPSLYLEHDQAARQTLAVKRSAAGQRWQLVGAPEQRVEIGANDHFADLHDFVARYAPAVSNPRFRFDLSADQIFVLVEKQPFRLDDPLRAWSPSEAADIRWPAYRLSDHRADLERKALRLCEAYRKTHSGVSVPYEDDVVRLYAIRP